MDGFTDVLRAILRAMTANALDNASLQKRELIGRDELHRLNCEVFVMVATFLVGESVGCHVMMRMIRPESSASNGEPDSTPHARNGSALFEHGPTLTATGSIGIAFNC